MAPRANWKGYLKLSLVSCAIALYPASSTSSRISFKTLNKKTGNPVKRIYIDPESEQEVPSHEQIKGYPVSKTEFITVTDEELDAVKIESSQTIDIEKFVPRSQIDPRYMDAPYYIAPDDRVAQEPFAVIRDAMKNKDVVAIGRVVISRRERLMMIEPWDKGLLGTVLRYGYEVRDDAAYFEDIRDVKIPDDMHELAEVIVQRKTGDWNPREFEDRYEEAIQALINSKQTGVIVAAAEVPKPHNVVNLMQALRESIAREKGAVEEPKRSLTRKVDLSAPPVAEERPLAGSKSRKPKAASANPEPVAKPPSTMGGRRKKA
jgi:DNA end-binding protein Ku